MTYGSTFYNGRTNRQRRRVSGKTLVKILAYGISEIIRQLIS